MGEEAIKALNQGDLEICDLEISPREKFLDERTQASEI
jgi:hypothetical protein